MDAYNQDNLIPGPENEQLMVELPSYHRQQQGHHPPHVTPGTVPVYAKGQPGHVHSAYGQSTVVTQPMVATDPVVVVKRPQNWMVPAILVCLCCFWPTGVFAICYAYQANQFADEMNMTAAERANRTARSLVIASVILGVVWCTVFTFLEIKMYNEPL